LLPALAAPSRTAFSRLKPFRRVATRYDKLDAHF
jgi:hypothetical protein